MPILSKQVTIYRCDRCHAESETPFATLPAGTKFPTIQFEKETILCQRCMIQITDPGRDAREARMTMEHQAREAEAAAQRDRERDRERAYQRELERDRDRPGHGGATGRPFGSRSSLASAPSSAWNILSPQGGSLPACAPGRARSLSGSDAQRGLLARLLSSQTPATSTSGSS